MSDRVKRDSIHGLVLHLRDIEGHLHDLYSNTVADFESDPKEDEGWVLYCTTKQWIEKLEKQNSKGDSQSPAQ